MTNGDCVDASCRPVNYDRVFEVLADRQRRVLLRRLVDEEIAGVDDLADAISERVDEPRSQVRLGLVHTHLPKLDETAIVDYDRRSETVRYYEHDFLEYVLDRTKAADCPDE